MISNQLSPLRLRATCTSEELAQAHAFCLLASYANNAFDTRTVQSFANAFGMTNYWRFPLVAGLAPSVVVAQIPYPWGNHVIVGLAGAQTLAQLAAIFAGSQFMVPTTAPVGRVQQYASLAATSVATALAGVPNIAALMADARNEITFAGYSIGGSVADVMAATTQALAPTRKIRLRKFAAPMVGDATWYANRPAQMDVACVYRQLDNIFALPMTALRTYNPVGSIQITGLPLWFRPDPSARVWDWHGDDVGRPPPTNGFDEATAYAGFLRGPVAGNACWNHMNESYRLMMFCRMKQLRNLGFFRYAYLEFPDDNRFQRLAERQENFDPAWFGLDDPAPTAIVIEDTDAELVRLHNAQPAQNASPAPQLGDALWGGGGEWVNPSIPSGRRRNRHAPVGGR